MTEIQTAAEWRGIQSALLVDVEAWQQKADQADDQPGVPPLIATDYAIAVREACRLAARAAQTAADTAGLYAEELEDAAATAGQVAS